MQPFTKITNPSKGLFVKVVWTGYSLSITGVLNPRPSGNATACGQILNELPNGRLKDTWRRWHRNDLNPGTPAQTAAIRTLNLPYDEACAYLTSINLNPDNGYSYGSKWLYEPVPEDVLAYLKNLPDTTVTPAWI